MDATLTAPPTVEMLRAAVAGLSPADVLRTACLLAMPAGCYRPAAVAITPRGLWWRQVRVDRSGDDVADVHRLITSAAASYDRWHPLPSDAVDALSQLQSGTRVYVVGFEALYGITVDSNRGLTLTELATLVRCTDTILAPPAVVDGMLIEGQPHHWQITTAD